MRRFLFFSLFFPLWDGRVDAYTYIFSVLYYPFDCLPMLHPLWFKVENYSGKDFSVLGFNSFREQKEFLETNYIAFQLSQVICLFVFPC